MTEYQKMGEQNAAIRGYILRVLVKGTRHCVAVRRISDMLQRDGYTMEPDISTHLDYLYELQYIKFLKPNVTPYNAYALDAVVGLSNQGILFIENGGDSESGIDL